MMIERAPAKLNLYLDITGSRADGYHELSGWMFEAETADRLSFSRSPESSGAPPVPTDFSFEFARTSELIRHERAFDLPLEKYSIYRALLLYFDVCRTCGTKPELPFRHIRLERAVPARAGLGGASSDAAALLRVICREHPQIAPALKERLGEIGADVPFSFAGGLREVTGYGEVLRSLPNFLAGRPLILLKPGFHISTARAFAAYDAAVANGRVFAETDKEAVREALETGSLKDLRAAARNTFTEVVDSAARRRIFAIISSLYEVGADYANMSGSGSCCFGIFAEEERRDEAMGRLLKQYGKDVWLQTTSVLN